MADIRIVLQTGSDFGGGMTGKFSESRVRQRDAAEFFERIGGEAIRPESAASGGEAF